MAAPIPVLTAEELSEGTTAYLEKCVEEKKVPTVSGLAYALGFESRQSIYDYKKRNKDENSAYIIKRTLLHIESIWEQELIRPQGNAGIIFWLKNRGWTDKTEIDQKTEIAYKVIKPSDDD